MQKKFNGKIGSWDISGVGEFSLMFYGAESFNQDLNYWGSNIGRWTEEYEPGEKSVDAYNSFKNSPLEKTPPYWYIELNSEDTDEYDDEYDG